VKRNHDRFETLAGALFLKEATLEERAEFERHAQTCERCRADAVSLGFPLLEVVEDAGRSETWQPSVAADVNGRIAESRQRRWRLGIGTLGYAVAASLAVNVLFVSGFAGRAIDALRVTPEHNYSATQPITIERRAKAVAAAAPARLTLERKARRAIDAYHVRPEKMKSERAVGDPSADAIAGLSVWDDADAGKRDVAQLDGRCEGSVDAVFVSDEPCPVPSEAR